MPQQPDGRDVAAADGGGVLRIEPDGGITEVASSDSGVVTVDPKSVGIGEVPTWKLRQFYVYWTIGLFAVQLVTVLLVVIVFAFFDERNFHRVLGLPEPDKLSPELIAALPRVVTPEVVMALIAATVAQAGAAFYFLGRRLLKDL